MSDWIPNALMRLLELSRLERDWDNYGADSVDPLALGYAVQLLGIWAGDEWNVPEPHISPLGGSGAIEFEWDEPEMLVNFPHRSGPLIHFQRLVGGETFTTSTLADLCERLAEIPGWLTA